LRDSELAAVAIPQLSAGSSALFSAAPLFRGPLARRRAIDSTSNRYLTEFALLNPQLLLNILEQNL